MEKHYRLTRLDSAANCWAGPQAMTRAIKVNLFDHIVWIRGQDTAFPS